MLCCFFFFFSCVPHFSVIVKRFELPKSLYKFPLLLLLSTSEITDEDEHVAGDLSIEKRVPTDDTKFTEDNDHPSIDNADTLTTTHPNVPEFNFVLDRGEDSAGEDTRGSPESG